MIMSNVHNLILTPDNPCNTIITDEETGKVMYRVVTEHGKKAVTKVENSSGELIASWEWRDVRSDIITLGSGKPMSMSSWLRKSMVPFKDTVYLDDGHGRKLKWKGNGPGLGLELFAEGDKQNPVARFSKSSKRQDRTVDPPKAVVSPAQLFTDSRGEDIRDLIVISFLALEKVRRTTEASTMNRADALTVPPLMSVQLGS
ncbi:hypothetical protein BDQ12DRAFT_734144 [Crucibulum laeve]|uniref:DUF6593 domain-containing protein n=1 Tax=Crucibulum laeve TaxID=68775 RepID=A0A5C3M5F8_9AGAR|nr:hypothetical protein BDQ12DRAFT_734144 [Crucibulum laeve]